MATMNVSLSQKLVDFVNERVASGLYNNASEVVRESLRLLKRREELDHLQLARLKKEVQFGIDASERGEIVHQTVEEMAEEEQTTYESIS